MLPHEIRGYQQFKMTPNSPDTLITQEGTNETLTLLLTSKLNQ